jgi:mono/diheme cytochrome c family protein
MKNKLLFFLLLTAFFTYAAPPVEEGKAIFTTRCAGCHNVNKQVLGPALAGIHERRSMEWIVNFVHSSQTLIQKGDKDAVALFKQFNNVPMPDHKDLSEANIESVVAYIKSEASAVKTKEAHTTGKKQPAPELLQLILESPTLLITFSTLGVLLITALLFAFQVQQYRKRVLPSK